MARALINVPTTAKRGEIIEIKALISHPMETGFRPGRDGSTDPARHHQDVSSAPITARRYSAPTSSRRSPPIRSSPSPRSRPRAARSPSAGPATAARRRPRRRRSRSNELGARCSLRAGPVASPAALAGRHRAPLKSRSADRRSGFDFMSRETQAMQSDDTANPGMLSVREGEALWTRKAGARRPRLRRLPRRRRGEHERRRGALSGVTARAQQRPIDLEQRINLCRETRQQATPLRWESRDLLGAHGLRRAPVARPADRAADDARLAPFRERGAELFEQRRDS